jgi:hypothetical protein
MENTRPTIYQVIVLGSRLNMVVAWFEDKSSQADDASKHL